MKFTTILNYAKRKHRSLAVCWVDLANACGSVHHSLIQHSLGHYHAPSKLTKPGQFFKLVMKACIHAGGIYNRACPAEFEDIMQLGELDAS